MRSVAARSPALGAKQTPGIHGRHDSTTSQKAGPGAPAVIDEPQTRLAADRPHPPPRRGPDPPLARQTPKLTARLGLRGGTIDSLLVTLNSVVTNHFRSHSLSRFVMGQDTRYESTATIMPHPDGKVKRNFHKGLESPAMAIERTRGVVVIGGDEELAAV